MVTNDAKCGGHDFILHLFKSCNGRLFVAYSIPHIQNAILWNAPIPPYCISTPTFVLSPKQISREQGSMNTRTCAHCTRFVSLENQTPKGNLVEGMFWIQSLIVVAVAIRHLCTETVLLVLVVHISSPVGQCSFSLALSCVALRGPVGISAIACGAR